MDIFEIIAERKIQEAMDKGKFDNLAGQGKPLDLEDLLGVPSEFRMVILSLKMQDHYLQR
ncbi:DnaJ family domain-containing protein [Clostridium cellulovorans]|uniref:DnaJ family domain-containing protein n=1 Tax=Clostridium cellulovorans TaxID=1493 RepID=UPI0001A97157